MRTPKSTPVTHIRWMIRRDMPEVLTTELASFEYSWTEEDFLRCLRQRNCIGMVAETDDRVIGFTIYELHKTRLHVLNFAVHPSARRAGIGAMLVEKLKRKQRTHRRREITLVVREENTQAQVFFRGHGFAAVEFLAGFYEDAGAAAGVRMSHAATGVSETTTTRNRIAGYYEEDA